MATLTNTKIKDTYDGLLKTADNDVIGASEKNITDGLGNATVLSIGTDSASFSSDIEVNGLTIGKGNGSQSANTAIGINSLSSTTGNQNTAIGYNTLPNNTTGQQNIAIGVDAMQENISGLRNVAIGYGSLKSNTNAIDNVAVGYRALYANTVSNNIAIGSGALEANTTGGVNTALGKDALNANTTGGGNTAIGYQTLQLQTSSSQNTAVGHLALQKNTNSYNTAVGSSALQYNTDGQQNAAFGYFALRYNTTGSQNSSLGNNALRDNVSGAKNTAIGESALANNLSSDSNTAVGYRALYISEGAYNTAVGSNALDNNSTGSFNSVMGYNTLGTNSSGSYNTAIGNTALQSDVDGDRNTALGYGAGYNKTSGDGNIYIGFQTQGGSTTSTNEIVIGQNATGNGSNTATYGNSSITHHYFTSGAVRIDSNSLQLVGDANPTIYVNDTTNNVGVGLQALDASTKIDSSHTFNIEIGNDIIQSVSSSGVDITGRLAVDTNTLYVDATNNRVGFGTSTPYAAIQAVGTIKVATGNAQGILALGDGAGTTINAGIWRGAANNPTSDGNFLNLGGYDGIVLATGNAAIGSQSEAMRIDSSGNVGIGTSPSSKLHLYTSADSDMALRVHNSPSNLYVGVDNTTGSRFIGSSGSAAYIGTTTSSPIQFATANTVRATIDSSGNVGIGTSSPANKLFVTANTAGDYAGFIENTNSTNGYGLVARTASTGTASYAFAARAASNDIFVVRADGKVGIGSSSPVSKLSLYEATEDVSITVNTGTGGSYPKKTGISFGSTSTSLGGDNEFRGGAGIQAINTASSNNPTDLLFWTTSGGSPAERMRIDSSGNVGIGTSSPSAPLEVNVGLNSLKISGRDTFIDSGIDSTNANIYVTQTGVGDFSQEAGHLVLQARTQGTVYRDIIFAGGLSNGEALMTIQGQGNVGIGTLSPAAKIHINSGAGNDVALFESTDQAATIKLKDSFQDVHFDQNASNFNIAVDPFNVRGASAFLFSIDGSERMRIDSSGRVGIGTSNPDALIDIGTNNIITLDDTGSSTGFIGFGSYNDGTKNRAQGASFFGFGLEIDRPNANISFNSYASSGKTNDILFLKREGQVGIGTSSPAAKIHSVDSGGSVARFERNVAQYFDFNANASSNNIDFYVGSNGKNVNLTMQGAYDGAMTFGTQGSERMRITSGGYLKASNYGTYTSPTGDSHELISNGTTWTAFVHNYSGSPYGLLIEHKSVAPNNTANNFIYAADSAALRFEVRSNGGISNYQANDVNLSDERVKTDINPLGSYWDKFKALEVVTFKYKDQTHDDNNIGLIAQQVESVAPEFVDADGFGETPEGEEPLKAIYTADLYHATIKVLQEAITKIETLEAKVATLESQLNA